MSADPTCCELACYEDPGCACEGCAPLAPETTDAGLLLKLLAESDIATTTYNDLRRVLVAVCAAYDRTVAKP